MTMTLFTKAQPLALAAPLFAAGAGAAHAADEVIRHRIPNSTFPISAAVEVPSSLTNVYLSGQVPPLQDAAAPKNTAAAYGGDTKGQTVGVLKAIEKSLTGLGLTMGDVVKMQVFLVGDPAKDNKMDFAGFMEGYTQFFGTTAQPRLPVRSAMQVAALANPAYLVEIEVMAVRPAKSK
jgi:enamine deaminase RidA (YjgF/YER057c/UK114 family)